MAAAWFSAWGKSVRDPLDSGVVAEWLPLHTHLADASGIARCLTQQWVPARVFTRLADSLGCDSSQVSDLVAWLAAVHDVGKISPAFAVQVPVLADAMRRHGLVTDPRLSLDPQRSLVRHELVGQLAVWDFLAGLGLPRRGPAGQLAGVVGGHHGEPADASRLSLARGRTDLSGDGAWAEARTQALSWATDLVGGPETLLWLRDRTVDQADQALLTALVIMADWLASDVDLFPLDPVRTAEQVPSSPDPQATTRRVTHAWRELQLPPVWSPQPVGDVAHAFLTRFGRPARAVQEVAVAAAQEQPTPGLLIIEAPMGEGKTEAALLAAEVLAARSGAAGCFVALPTRATTDAMFHRVLAWMRVLPGVPRDVSVVLAHGTASLNDTYRGLRREPALRAIGEEGDDEVGVAHQWLRGRKRGPLAQFLIGTVDQLLFAGLKSRHLVLRHLALAGKVVIVDEVHAYDVYMSAYLDRVLHWLGTYGTPVVLLSATLPAKRRDELLDAYRSGQTSTTGTDVQEREDGTWERGAAQESGGVDLRYPLVSGTGLQARTAVASRSASQVQLERAPDDLEHLVRLLRASLEQGGCAVVIRNTVTRVQETADRLLAEFGPDAVSVSHSRFLAVDRARLDQQLLHRFGPEGAGVTRPHQHVVVASQVVEQSLDVDFDLMVSDLAPIDLLLQRLGRLHRHQRSRPAAVSVPRCVVTGVEDWAGAPVRAVSGSRVVYGELQLLQAAAELLTRDHVTLPDDIAVLVQTAYGPGVTVPGSWATAVAAAAESHEQDTRRRRSAAETFLLPPTGGPLDRLDHWVRGGVGDVDADPRGSARVRDGDESFEVLVVERDMDGGLLTPSWLEGGAKQLPTDLPMGHGLARTVASCALRLPPHLCRPGVVGDGVIAALERNRFDSFERHPLLSGQLVLVLDAASRSTVLQHGAASFRLSYDVLRGLTYEQL